MKQNNQWSIPKGMLSCRRALVLMALAVALIWAAPVFEEPYQFDQPDGSSVSVVVTGGTFFQEVRTPAGALLMRDSDGWIYYARISDDAQELLSTGVRYLGGGEENPPPPALGNEPQTLAPESIRRQVQERRRLLLGEEADQKWEPKERPKQRSNRSSDLSSAPPPAAPDTIWGLTVLADFPGTTSAAAKQELTDLLNKSGYTGYSNNGSVRDYYYEVSNGRLVYVNRVVGFVTVSKPKSSYDYAGSDPQLFMNEVLALAKNTGFDFKTVTRDASGNIRGVNILYAGTPSAGWAQGLWPHQGTLRTTFTAATGIYVRRYEMTNIGSSPAIGTIAHENGHLLFRWPDLYSYDKLTNGAGSYCLMSTSGKTNPIYPNAYFRFLEGWVDTLDITRAAKGTTFTQRNDASTVYVYSGKTHGSSTYEAYFIETKTKTGRNSNLPDAGLAIWHIDSKGNNAYNGGKNSDLANIEQADGRYDLENKVNSGDKTDLFKSSVKTTFNDATAPSAKWHNGANSGIDIRNISAAGASMTFSIGEANNVPFITITSPSSSVSKVQGEMLQIRWQDNIPEDVKIELLQNSSVVSTIATVPSNGSYDWTIPRTVAAGRYNLRIISTNGSPSATTSFAITIVADLPALAVTKGSGSGTYEVGAKVAVKANEALCGELFDGWSGDVSYLASSTEPQTTVTMPDKNIAITATYRTLPPNGILMPAGLNNIVRLKSDTLFYDDGGECNNYSARFDGEITFVPDVERGQIAIEFLEFAVEDTSSYRGGAPTVWDSLSIFDGRISDAIQIGSWHGPTGPSGEISSTASDGTLSVRFHSDEGKQDAGWVARVKVLQTSRIADLPRVASARIERHAEGLLLHLPQRADAGAMLSIVAPDGRLMWRVSLSGMEAGTHLLHLGNNWAAGHYIARVRLTGGEITQQWSVQ